MSSAPKKYADPDRTQVTAEWKAWHAREMERLAEDGWQILASLGFDPAVYLPDEKTIPDEGAWILVIEEPFTEMRSRFRVPLLSMWRARPHVMSSGGVELGKGMIVRPHQAVIRTPGGDLHLWPHEYVVATDPYGLVSDPDATLHSLGGEPVLDEDEVFYLMSRGIPHQQAVMLLFSRIESPDFVYVTFPEEITAALEGVGRPLHRHIALSRYPS